MPADGKGLLGIGSDDGVKVWLNCKLIRDGDRVYAQLTDQPKFEIYPKCATEFFWKVVDAQVTFVKDARGKVTKAVHHQNGATIEAPKIE